MEKGQKQEWHANSTDARVEEASDLRNEAVNRSQIWTGIQPKVRLTVDTKISIPHKIPYVGFSHRRPHNGANSNTMLNVAT